MADGFTISAEGLTESQRGMELRARRMRDLSPPLRVVAAEIEERTDRAFRDSTSPYGEPWPALAPSTLLARAAKLPGARRRGKGGKLTRGARGKRSSAIAAYNAGAGGIFKPLVDTGRMRGSVRVRVTGNELEFAAVGYMAPHITGGIKNPARPPKRNPTVFQRAASGELQAIPSILSMLLRAVSRYVATGSV